MGTVVDNCNVALGLLGDRANVTSIDPPEGSAQADHCARFYPLARDEALAAEDWTFASTYDSLTEIVGDHPVWGRTYALPADCLIVREMRLADGTIVALDPHNPQFEMATIASGTKVLLTNGDANAVRFTRRVNDPTKYSPGFTAALHYLLASYLAGPVIKGKAGVQTAQAMRVAYDGLRSQAAVTDANQNSVRQHHVPSAMRARGYGGRETIIEKGQERYSLPYWAV